MFARVAKEYEYRSFQALRGEPARCIKADNAIINGDHTFAHSICFGSRRRPQGITVHERKKRLRFSLYSGSTPAAANASNPEAR